MPLPEVKNVLSLEGEVDLHVSPEIATKLGGLIRERPARVVVDLSRVTYIDSSGLAVFVGAMQEVEDYGGRFALAGVQEKVRLILETSRLDQVLMTYPHVDAALAAI
jgi:anti-sigma B factor antagonist